MLFNGASCGDEREKSMNFRGRKPKDHSLPLKGLAATAKATPQRKTRNEETGKSPTKKFAHFSVGLVCEEHCVVCFLNPGIEGEDLVDGYIPARTK